MNDVAAEPTTSGDPEKEGARALVGGSLTTRYRGRSGADRDDHDLYETVVLEIGDERSPARAYVMGQAALDLDGGSRDATFYSLADTYDSDLVTQLYYAWVDVRPPPGFDTLTLGRQVLHDTPELAYFDGAHVATTARTRYGVRLGAFGGIPAYPYDSSRSGDVLAGLYLEARPWERAAVRLDWLHAEDDRVLGPEDDLFGIRLEQQVGRGLRLAAEHTRVEGAARDLALEARAYDAEIDLSLDVRYYRQLETQRDLAVPLDPFYTTLFEYFPFQQVRAAASKGLGGHVSLEGGADVRRVEDEDDVGQFNRDFERYWLTASFFALSRLELDLSLTGEIWRATASDVSSWGVDVRKELGERWEGGIGSYYSLFKYDLFESEERDDVRTYFVRIDFEPTASYAFDLRYELEENDLDDFHALRGGVTWRF